MALFSEKIDKSHWFIICLFAFFLNLIFIFFCLFSGHHFIVGRLFQDTILWIDALYRLELGQVPHVDFKTPLGALQFYVPHFFNSIFSDSVISLKASLFSYAVVFGAVAFLTTVRRFPPFIALLISVYVSLLVGVPAMFGAEPSQTTMAMHYNRLGWATLLIVTVMTFQPTEKNTSQSTLLVEAILVGALIFFAAFTKVTYFAAVLAVLVFYSLIFRKKLSAISIPAFFAVSFCIAWWVFNLSQVNGYIRDILEVAEVSSGKFRGKSLLFDLKGELITFFIGFSLLVLLAIDRKSIRLIAFRHCLMALSLAFIGLALFNQNFQYVGLPLLFYPWLAFFKLSQLTDLLPKLYVKAISFAVISLITIPTISDRVRNLVFFSKGDALKERGIEFGDGLQGWALSDALHPYHSDLLSNGQIVIESDDFREAIQHFNSNYWRSSTVAHSYIIGRQLILELFGPKKGIVIENLDFTNVYPSYLGTPPPPGRQLAQSWGREISEANISAAISALDYVDVIMVPSFPQNPSTAENLMTHFGAYIEQNFELVSDTAYWKIFARKS